MAREVMDQLVKNGKVTRGYIGAIPQDITPELARAFKSADGFRCCYHSRRAEHAGSKAGLKEGDVVTAINGEPVNDANGLRLRVSRTAPGTTLRMTVQRPKAADEVNSDTGAVPEQANASDRDEEQGGGRFGHGASSTMQGL